MTTTTLAGDFNEAASMALYAIDGLEYASSDDDLTFINHEYNQRVQIVDRANLASMHRERAEQNDNPITDREIDEAIDDTKSVLLEWGNEDCEQPWKQSQFYYIVEQN